MRWAGPIVVLAALLGLMSYLTGIAWPDEPPSAYIFAGWEADGTWAGAKAFPMRPACEVMRMTDVREYTTMIFSPCVEIRASTTAGAPFRPRPGELMTRGDAIIPVGSAMQRTIRCPGTGELHVRIAEHDDGTMTQTFATADGRVLATVRGAEATLEMPAHETLTRDALTARFARPCDLLQLAPQP